MVQEGDKAPSFNGIDQEGKEITLSQYRGSKLALYFYPKDDTPACTTQACNLRDNFQLLKDKGIAVIGVSPDDLLSHQKFITKYSLPFPLLSDPQHKIINRYGVWGEKQLYGKKYMGLNRTTFLINEKGIIEKVFLRPRNKLHSSEILQAAGFKP